MPILEQLLQDLSGEMNIILKEDSNRSCQINFNDKINIQLELDPQQENIIIGAMIGELFPGKYRENVFREALIENGFPPPKIGTFAYSEQKNTLVFFEKKSIQELDARSLYEAVNTLKEKALYWKECLQRGEIPQVKDPKDSFQKKGGSIFDIK
jgi:hypothetical protein